MTTAVASAHQPAVGSRSSGSLYDVLELILDRGLVIDAFVRVSLVGIELVKIDVRVVVASVDTYLRFAQACNRLDLEGGSSEDPGVPELVGSVTESGSRGKTKGALAGAAETISDAFRRGRDDDGPEDDRPGAESGGEPETESGKESRGTRRTSSARREKES
jgi:hypothetical protein